MKKRISIEGVLSGLLSFRPDRVVATLASLTPQFVIEYLPDCILNRAYVLATNEARTDYQDGGMGVAIGIDEVYLGTSKLEEEIKRRKQKPILIDPKRELYISDLLEYKK